MENALKFHANSVGDETVEGGKNFTPNRFANLWLLILGVVLALTLLCTGVLVAWPILAQIAAWLD